VIAVDTQLSRVEVGRAVAECAAAVDLQHGVRVAQTRRQGGELVQREHVLAVHAVLQGGERLQLVEPHGAKGLSEV
jgi:hypothetical protein